MKKIITLLLVLVMLVPMCLVTNADAQQKSFQGVTWGKDISGYSNIENLYRINISMMGSYVNFGGLVYSQYTDGDVTALAEKMKKDLNARPEGQRYIHYFGPDDTMELNENGRYEITWRIKDGALLYTDRYSLRYVVEVDETAEGFRYDTFYPANDYTYATYTDENGDPQLAEIPVPEVKEYEEETFDEGDRGIKIYKSSSLDRTPLSDIVFDIYHVVPAEGETLTQNPSEEEYGKYAVEENLVVTLTTDANGYAAVNLTDLGYGDGYYLIIERPNEKVKAPADPFYVIVPMIDEETHEPLDVVVIYPKNEPVPPVPPPVPPYDEEKKGWFSVLKHSAAGEDIVLPNAQFQLYRLAEEGEEAVLTMDYGARTLNLIPVMLEEEPVILTTDEKGYAKSPELDFGLYFLVETKAPAGYSLLEEPVPVFATLTGFEMAYAVRIPNSEGLFLPETGGIGTTIFTVLGILLCVGAVAVLILRKRRAE